MVQQGSLVASVVSRKLTRLPPLNIRNEFIVLSPTPRTITVFSKAAGVVLYETNVMKEDIHCWGTFGDCLMTGSMMGIVQVYSISNDAIELAFTLPMPDASCRLVDLAGDETRILALTQTNKTYSVFSYGKDDASWKAMDIKIDGGICQWIRPYGNDGMVLIGRKSVCLYDAHGEKQVLPTIKATGHITTCAVRDTCVAVGYDSGSLLVWQGDTVRRLHWHAHGVSSIAIGIDGSIHSVGQEAVWITWDAVNDRPKQMLPRIAPAPIDHILCVDPDKMILYANNTIFMYDTITLQLFWKYQGVVQTAKRPEIYGSVGENRLAVSGSAGNISVLQHTTIQSEWMVAPHNRVSNINKKNDVPPPDITCTAQYEGKWLTVHKNYLEGSPNLVVTQFWDRPNQCVASMVQEEAILTCALHKETAVTITSSELQFWDHHAAVQSWACHMKVAIPAGFAKHKAKAKPAYSDDGSVMAVAFGRHVTLWNPNTVKLLLSIPLVEDIQQIAFVMDALVVRTLSEVTCLSALGNKHWAVTVPATAMGVAGDTVVVSDVEAVLVLDAFTGAIVDQVKHNHGTIVSIYVRLRNDYRVQIHAATKNGEVLEIKDSSLGDQTNDISKGKTLETKHAPTLPSFEDSSRKRRFIEIFDLEDWCPDKMVPMEQLADEELPLMRGEFVMAFLGRNLRRKPQQ